MLLTDWVQSLINQNLAFDALKNKRTSVTAVQPESNMKHERLGVDEAYRAIVGNASTPWPKSMAPPICHLCAELNQNIDNYALLVAQRMGATPAMPRLTPPAPP